MSRFLLLWPFFLPLSWATTIMIDPGHGGEDLGAQVSYWEKGKEQSTMKMALEKYVTLSLAKILYQELKEMGYQVYLSRTHDRTVALQSRAQMVDMVGADLLISIHANSSKHKNSQGIETFYLDNHKDKTMRRVEQLENSSLSEEGPIVQQILRDLVISKTAPLSKRLASSIHKSLGQRVIGKYALRNRGIRPGLFYILALSQRPAVLLEIGFLSHPKERELIMRPEFQRDYARAVARGVANWLTIKKVDALSTHRIRERENTPVERVRGSPLRRELKGIDFLTIGQ